MLRVKKDSRFQCLTSGRAYGSMQKHISELEFVATVTTALFFCCCYFLPPKMWSRNFFDKFQDWHMSGSLLHAAKTTIDLHIADYFLTRIFVWALCPVFYPLEQMVPCPGWDRANRCTDVITCTCLNLPDLKKRCPLPVFDPMVADGLMPRFGSREQMPHATWCRLTLRSTICG